MEHRSRVESVDTLDLEGAVQRYCFDTPFNLTVCFITKCGELWLLAQNGGPWTAVYHNVQTLVTFFLAYNVHIDWQE